MRPGVAGTEQVLTGWGHSWIQGLATPPAPRLSWPGLTFCIIWSSSRRHCTSFFRYCNSFSFTRSST